ncbi:collectin-12-like [Corythoichthys intestinalis]|uniref:collectin-12-like n=1 Tax=Corythoichthys intestinalis TaxID=161448 RepID=UPI0025A54D7F|nr:collectin-12-like [Corythoichthys intestinalis]XP_057685237.1 collectin-12-like [Corythoichthys intestinalis]XP_057685238.1 collectin-12-like [Corythoichthys intestinalis]XP_057685246.1 collectin-12-like [Corythoichthys intestinalis]XP_057685249.1 collectin-12-like [Corythoichthys intestinalis]XP_057699360.1 collectin-12-like [Corythoichthys intestinalis]XP_057709093.1 collectin-12-like [Corythoichthys intestinalis]
MKKAQSLLFQALTVLGIWASLGRCCGPTSPPATRPPATRPPVTRPPVTRPPVTVAPATVAPPTGPPVTGPPVTGPPVTVAPVTVAPATGPPLTVAPATGHPATGVPVTGPPVTVAPATVAPATVAPATGPPVTVAPATVAPATVAPPTGPPVTGPPVTVAPATGPPLTVAPATGHPATGVPVTGPPVTVAPATVAPATGRPPTGPPVTVAPVTVAPTTGPRATGPPLTGPDKKVVSPTRRPKSAEGCQAPWRLNNQHSYCFANDSKSWDDAKRYCSSNGGHLLIIRSSAERDWLKEQLDGFDYWIGLKSPYPWKWIDGTPLKSELALWDAGEPNLQNEDCVEMGGRRGRLNDLSCTSLRRYICKRCQDSDEIMYNGIKGTCNLQVDVYQEVSEVLFKERLYAGCIIVIQGKVKPNPTKFIVHLSLGHGEDTPMRIEVDFKDGDLELLTRIGSHVDGKYVNKIVKKDSFPFAAGSDFEMTIECGDDIFRLAVGNDFEVEYENDGYDLQDIHRLLVEDDVTVTNVRLI